MRRRLLALGLTATLAIVIGACSPAQLRTAAAPQNACDDAMASGRLVVDATSGLALADTTGRVTPMLWPFGYSARRDPSGVVLLDNTGHTANILAREGDFTTLGGGTGNDGVFVVCAGSVKVVPAPG